jgi:transposase
LELGLLVDLLPNRSVETVSARLMKHSSIEIVSRDGSSEYASTIKKGAPQARQVSDRWRMVKNLAACVSVQLTQLRRAELAGASAPEEQPSLPERQSHPRTRGSETGTTSSFRSKQLVTSGSWHSNSKG